jgi:hypothetical protein
MEGSERQFTDMNMDNQWAYSRILSGNIAIGIQIKQDWATLTVTLLYNRIYLGHEVTHIPSLIGVEPRLTRHLDIPLTLWRIYRLTLLHTLNLVPPRFKLRNQRSTDPADA